ncbi:hypothetical protein PUN28_011483 [Cardiocondyla obscurior]
MRWIYEAIDRHWSIFTDDIEVRIMEEYSILSRKLVTYYTIIICGTLLVIIILPLTPIFLDIIVPLNESRPRLFAVEIEFRVNKTDYYFPIYCYISAVIIVGSIITLGTDTMHIICASHACSLFAAVR